MLHEIGYITICEPFPRIYCDSHNNIINSNIALPPPSDKWIMNRVGYFIPLLVQKFHVPDQFYKIYGDTIYYIPAVR